ncbi:acid-sensing ion channel 2-like, partial [Argonauta hians]
MDVPAGNEKFHSVHGCERKTSEEILPELLSEFCQETSLHGMKNINDSKKYRLRGVLWAVALVGMTFAVILSMVDLFTEYNQYPVLTRINVGFAERLPFPAVTLCNLNPVDRTKINFEKLKDYFLAFTQGDSLAIQLINWTDPAMEPFKKPMNKTWVRKISPGLKSMLYECRWEGRYLKPKCLNNFTENFTELGICYTFNGANHSEQYGPLYTSHTGSSTGLVLSIYINESTYIFNEDMASGVKYKFLASPYKAFPNSFCLDTNTRIPPRKLKHHLYYSYNACVRECRVAFVLSQCGCHSVFEPGDGPTCSGRQLLICRVGAVGIVGGQMGLFLGASILTISELAEFIAIFFLSASHHLLKRARVLGQN